jgi:thiol-disulfide isomerase/thioredoxin
MKRFLIFLLLFMIITGCSNKNTFTVNGVINGGKKNYIYLKRVNVDTPVLIDSSKISKKGGFRFKVKANNPDFYQIGYSNSDFITILADPGEKLNLEFNGTNLFQNYTVTGSKGSEQIRMLDLRLAETKRKLDSLSTVYNNASKEPGFEERGPILEAEFNNLIKDLRKKNIEFIITHMNSMASIKALYQKIDEKTYVLYDPRDLQYLKIASDSLIHYFPNSKHVQALVQDVKKELDQIYSRQLQNMAGTFPETKLNPDLKDITGKRVAFSSLRGKIVLLTFWSVSSKECIAENLQLKEFYKIYNRKGFEIYQINLDENEADWKAEVKFDELPWISTREDNPLDPKNAMLFNVKTLPTNYLFDRNGTIIASNLHGKSLQIKLDQLFNN